MATSGTYAFTLDIADVFEEAYERIGAELRSGYDYRTARRSLDLLLLEWQNRGLNLWTIRSASQALTPGTAAYTLSGEKLDIIEALLRTNAGNQTQQADLSMERISISTYAQKTNKLTQGKPLQYWIERTPAAIIVNLWPVPDASTPYTFFYYYMERIEDTGKPASNNVDVPARHLPALTAGLAYQLAMKRPESAPLIPMLKEAYEEQWSLAADSVREKAALRLVPEVM